MALRDGADGRCAEGGGTRGADRTAAKERYEEALRDANRIAAMDLEQVVEEAIETVRWLMGGTLGSDDMISYDASSKGDEAREGQLLVETLLAHFVSLAGVLPFKHWMATHWREVSRPIVTGAARSAPSRRSRSGTAWRSRSRAQSPPSSTR